MTEDKGQVLREKRHEYEECSDIFVFDRKNFAERVGWGGEGPKTLIDGIPRFSSIFSIRSRTSERSARS